MTFEELYTKYFNPLVYFAKNRIHDEDAAKDLVQDVFRRIWEGDRLKGMRNEVHTKTYIYQGVLNACKNHFNGMKPNDSIEQAYYLESGEDISNDYIRIELYRILSELIEQLPPECRRIINLYYRQGFASGEIAKMLGLHTSTVKNQMRRGVGLIKELMYRKPIVKKHEKEPIYPRSISQHNAIIFHLKTISGLTFRETSDVLGDSLRSVSARYYNFTKACKTYLNSKQCQK